jgi:hypothetical protein
MSNYIFLDTWVLSDYTTEDKQHLLSELIRAENYTILINGLSTVELYNPGWQQAEDNDRTIRAARFLGQHSCAIVRPDRIFKSEIESFPARLERLPVELSLDDLVSQHRVPALLSILRGEGDFFLEHGIDIKRWVSDYNSAKAAWRKDAERIIESACKSGVLTRNKSGQFVELEKRKEEFLVTLDRRHFGCFSFEEMQGLGTKLIDLFMGATKSLPAIRFSSLCFWYAYVDTDKAYAMKRKGSDIGDFFQMSLIPYCSTFTMDTTMYRLAHRLMTEANYDCQIYDREGFDAMLSRKRA